MVARRRASRHKLRIDNEGGRFQIEGNASGTIQRCNAPHSFTATWEYGGEVSWIELRLTSEANGRTRFELEHTAHVDDER